MIQNLAVDEEKKKIDFCIFFAINFMFVFHNDLNGLLMRAHLL